MRPSTFTPRASSAASLSLSSFSVRFSTVKPASPCTGLFASSGVILPKTSAAVFSAYRCPWRNAHECRRFHAAEIGHVVRFASSEEVLARLKVLHTVDDVRHNGTRRGQLARAFAVEHHVARRVAAHHNAVEYIVHARKLLPRCTNIGQTIICTCPFSSFFTEPMSLMTPPQTSAKSTSCSVIFVMPSV